MAPKKNIMQDDTFELLPEEIECTLAERAKFEVLAKRRTLTARSNELDAIYKVEREELDNEIAIVDLERAAVMARLSRAVAAKTEALAVEYRVPKD